MVVRRGRRRRRHEEEEEVEEGVCERSRKRSGRKGEIQEKNQ